MKQLNLNENDFKKWANRQLRSKLFLKKRINNKQLPTIHDNLIKLWDEWKDKLETDWSLVQEQVEEVDDNS